MRKSLSFLWRENYLESQSMKRLECFRSSDYSYVRIKKYLNLQTIILKRPQTNLDLNKIGLDLKLTCDDKIILKRQNSLSLKKKRFCS